MASILDRYGIKEVADVTFYKIEDDGSAGAPALFLDTLKVSTIEQTAENTSARGGKGNPELIIWDYGKEITVTLEDALFSAKSMAVMFGDGENAIAAETFDLRKTISFIGSAGKPSKWDGPDGTAHEIPASATIYDENGAAYTDSTFESSKRYFCTFNVAAEGVKIEISPNSFPGNYYVTGDTYARSEITGRDEFFQFIIHKAKVLSENTITMEAEGDPSTFSMNLKVLRPADGKMMELVKYDLVEG